jgi:hypothetical protein
MRWQLPDRISLVIRKASGLFPLTGAGLFVLALSLLAFWLQGFGKMDLVLLAAGFLGLVITALMVLLVAAAAIALHLRWKRGSTRPGAVLECDVAQPTGFLMPWPRALPLLAPSWSWEEPGSVQVFPPERGAWVETILPGKRGIYPHIVRKVTIGDVLGLASISFRERESTEISILPHRGALDQMSLLEGLAAGEDLCDPRGDPYGDRVDMRQYAAGDSPRLILWKSYARTRRLLVRVPERALTAKPRSCAYLVAGSGDEPGAGLMRVILERGFLGESWRFGADGAPSYACNLADALRLLTRSGNFVPDEGTALPEFLAQAGKDGYSACLLIVPSSEGRWIDPVLAAIAQTRLRLHLYTALDGAPDGLQVESRWKRWFLQSESEAGRNLEDAAFMARHFAGISLPFLLADRRAGKICGDIRALLPKHLPAARRGA